MKKLTTLMFIHLYLILWSLMSKMVKGELTVACLSDEYPFKQYILLQVFTILSNRV